MITALEHFQKVFMIQGYDHRDPLTLYCTIAIIAIIVRIVPCA